MTGGQNITVGIDDIATGTQQCSGYTVFSLPDDLVPEFSKRAAAILSSNPKLKVFHAKKYTSAQRDQYREFLHLIREFSEGSELSGAHCSLISKNTRVSWEEEGVELARKAITGANVPEQPVLDIVKPYLWPLLVMGRSFQDIGSGVFSTVHLDSGSEYKDLDQTVNVVQGTPIRAEVILRAYLNGLLKHQLEAAPSLSRNGLSILSDSKSAMIQAADVLGNFSMAGIFKHLGSDSKSKNEKAELMTEVFGSLMDPITLSPALRMQGDDLILAEPEGVVKFSLSWVDTDSDSDANGSAST